LVRAGSSALQNLKLAAGEGYSAADFAAPSIAA
jgi:hypothetical protein